MIPHEDFPVVLLQIFNSCAVRRMSYKMGSVSSFCCHICACKFMHAYIYHAMFRQEGGRGLFKIFSSSCKNSFVEFGKRVEILKKQYSKMYIAMQYQFILHEKNIVRVTSKQPPIPSFNCPRTIACCYMSRCFFQPLPGCKCFSQNLHKFVEVFFDMVEPEVSF